MEQHDTDFTLSHPLNLVGLVKSPSVLQIISNFYQITKEGKLEEPGYITPVWEDKLDDKTQLS